MNHQLGCHEQPYWNWYWPFFTKMSISSFTNRPCKLHRWRHKKLDAHGWHPYCFILSKYGIIYTRKTIHMIISDSNRSIYGFNTIVTRDQTLFQLPTTLQKSIASAIPFALSITFCQHSHQWSSFWNLQRTLLKSTVAVWYKRSKHLVNAVLFASREPRISRSTLCTKSSPRNQFVGTATELSMYRILLAIFSTSKLFYGSDPRLSLPVFESFPHLTASFLDKNNLKLQ